MRLVGINIFLHTTVHLCGLTCLSKNDNTNNNTKYICIAKNNFSFPIVSPSKILSPFDPNHSPSNQTTPSPPHPLPLNTHNTSLLSLQFWLLSPKTAVNSYSYTMGLSASLTGDLTFSHLPLTPLTEVLSHRSCDAENFNVIPLTPKY